MSRRHQFYRNYDEWQRNNSSFQQSLNGRWQFNFFNNPQQLPDKLLLTGREIKNTTSILVPSEIELQGYAQNQYTNDRYPWEGKIYRRPAYILDKMILKKIRLVRKKIIQLVTI